jgi:phage terminase small subunit
MRDRFVDEYLVDLNATKAAERAGYSKKTARSQGNRLLTKVDIQAAIKKRLDELKERTEVSQEWVIERLKENVARSMQLKPVLDKDGAETGEFTYQGNVANRALELIGRHLGMYLDRQEVSGKDGGPVQLTYVPAKKDGDEA